MHLRLPLSALAVVLAPDADEGAAAGAHDASSEDASAESAAKPARAPRAPKVKPEAVVDQPLEAPAASAPEVRNLTFAPFYYDDKGAGLPDKGMLVTKNRKALTLKQWARRTPAQWGVLVANGHVEVFNVPAADVPAFEAAVAKEEARLAKLNGLNATERAMFGGTPKI